MTTTSSFAYFDCFAGIAGDMALGALLDAGGDLEALRAGLRGLDLEPFDGTLDAELQVGPVFRAEPHATTRHLNASS